jgi:MoxR-like ATPase
MTAPAANPMPASPVAAAAAVVQVDPDALAAAVAAAQALHADLCAAFYERDVEAMLLLLAYVAEEHVLLLGPHGTAKTALTTAFAAALGVNPDDVWAYLFGKFTLPDNVFGPLDVRAYKQGVERRVTTRKLPSAVVACADEIFKAGDGILNGLLTILNERQYDNPDRQRVPLQLCVGLSNELPEGGPHGPLAPLYDRFLLRRWTAYMGDESNVETLLAQPQEPTITASLTDAQVAQLRAARRAVSLTGPTGLQDDDGTPLNLVQVVVRKLKRALEADGLVVSDRRWRKAMKVVQAHAVLNGRSVATLADLAPLAHSRRDEVDDVQKVASHVERLANADLATARSLHAVCVQQVQSVPVNESDDAAWSGAAAQASRKITATIGEMRKLPHSQEIAALVVKCEGYVEALRREQSRRFGL